MVGGSHGHVLQVVDMRSSGIVLCASVHELTCYSVSVIPSNLLANYVLAGCIPGSQMNPVIGCRACSKGFPTGAPQAHK